MKKPLHDIEQVILGAKAVRPLSMIEIAILAEVKALQKDQWYSRKDVLALLKRQIRCSANAVGRMSSRAGDLEIMQKLNDIKPIKF